MIDLVDGLSLGSVVLISVTDGNLADHDARLGGGAVECLLSHGDQAHAIALTLLVVIRVLLAVTALATTRLFPAAQLMKVGYSGCVIIESRQASWPAQNIGSRTSTRRSLRPAIRPIFSRQDL